MDPLLQWMLGIYATLTVAAIIASAKALFSIKDELSGVKTDMKLFVVSAEARFETLESRVDKIEHRTKEEG